MKRFISLLLALLMTLSMLPFSAYADEEAVEPEVTETVAEEKKEEPKEEKKEEPKAEKEPDPVKEEPAEEPVCEEPKEKPAEEPAEPEEETEEPEKEPEEQPVEEPAENPADPEEEPKEIPEESAVEPTEQPEAEPAVEITLKKLKDVTVSGGEAAFTVKAETSDGSKLAYQWQQLDDSVKYKNDAEREAAWQNIDKETEDTLELKNITAESFEIEYAKLVFRCVITAKDGTVAYTEEVELVADPAWAKADGGETVETETEQESAENKTASEPEQEEITEPKGEQAEEQAEEESATEAEFSGETTDAEQPTTEGEPTEEEHVTETEEPMFDPFTGEELPATEGVDPETDPFSEENLPALEGGIASGTCGTNLTWELNDTGMLTISGTGAMNGYSLGDRPWHSLKDSIIQACISEGVTSICGGAFSGCSSLSSITIPNSVTDIGKSAFEGCSGLTSVTIPNSVTRIDGDTFHGCSSLTSVTIPNSVTDIGRSAFEDCSGLTSITIPNSVTDIDGWAFSGCSSLRSVTIPNSVTEIGERAFAECSGLTSITIPNSVTRIDDEAFHGCSSLTSVTIPNSVTDIGRSAFEGCSSLSSVTIPNSVTRIDDDTFHDCSGLTSITIPNGVTSIGCAAFSDCSGLILVTIPSSVTDIGGDAFSGCEGLKAVHITDLSAWNSISFENDESNPLNYAQHLYLNGSNVENPDASGTCGTNLIWELSTDGVLTIFGTGAMNNYLLQVSPWYANRSSILSVIVGDGVTSIGDVAFYGCSGLTSVTIPSSVTSIGQGAFDSCSGLTSVAIPNSVTSIGGSVFYRCSGLASITIPNSVTKIGDNAFYCCSGLTSITIPSSVTSIGGSAFSGCTGLTSVTIPNSVTSIDNAAFSGCSGLASITIPNSVTSIGAYAFSGCTGLTSVTIPNSVTSIGEYAFYNCKKLASVTIPSSVTSIGAYAFSGCTGLNSVHITDLSAWNNISFENDESNPFYYAQHLYLNGVDIGNRNLTWELSDEGVLTISGTSGMNNYSSGGSPWYGNRSSIRSVIVSDGVTSIGAGAFYGCTGLTSITIPNSVTSIGNSAFSGCYSLSSVTIPNSVTSIGAGAFYGCTGLTSITIPNSVTRIGNYAFGSSGLKSITIPNSVTSMGDRAFYECYALTSVTIPNSVTSIGEGAFYYCNKLASVTIPNSVTDIGRSAFEGCSRLSSVTIPNSVTSIGAYAFYGCRGLASVTILNSVTSIGQQAFDGCSGLTSVTIPNSVTSIGAYAFSGCKGLTSITIPNSVTSIGVYAFFGCSGLTSITIPNSVTRINDGTFFGCSGLTSITIPNSVTSIGNSAFKDCTGLITVYITDIEAWNKISFGNSFANPLYYAQHLYLNGEEVTDFVIGIASGTCGSSLKWFLTDEGALTISGTGEMNNYSAGGSPWFANRSGIRSVIVRDGVTSIGENAFYGFSGLTSVTISNSVTSIGAYAFRDCSGLTSVTIPNSVTSIGNSAFSGCSRLNAVRITDIEAWRAISFGDSFANPIYYAKHLYLNGKEVDAFVGVVAYGICGTNLTWELSDKGVLTISGTGEMNNYAYYAYNGGSSSPWYGNRSSIRSVIVGDGVTSIGDYAFYGCSVLTSITIPNSVTSIGNSAFYGCRGLASVTIPNSVTSIGADAFRSCSGLASITIPNSVTSIGDRAFYDCKKLTSVTIPNSVTSIGGSAFAECSGLTLVTIPNSVTSIGAYAFYGCRGLASVTIPNSVTSIGADAFRSCSGLTSITIPDSVTSIGENAFYYCDSLTSVHITDISAWCNISYNNSVFTRKHHLYKNGVEITDLVIPNNVTSIGNYAFDRCDGLTSVTIPNSVTSIGNSAFYGCSGLASVTIPNSVTSIGAYAFYYCSGLTAVTIPNSVTSIGAYAFCGCSGLTSVTILDGVTSIGVYAFSRCSGLTSITIPNSVTSIGEWAFFDCSGLVSVTIHGNATSIEAAAFSTCSSLTSVTLEGVISIGDSAFHDCIGLTSITLPSSLKCIQNTIFLGCSKLVHLTVEDGNSVYYSSGDCVIERDTGMLVLAGSKVNAIPQGVKIIGDYAFESHGLTSITIPSSVTSIGNGAFYGCSGLKSITIPNSVTSIGESAFAECSSLNSITIPNGVTSIGNAAFYGCRGLTSITIPNSVTSIGDYAFDDCSGLTSITIPNSVTSIGESAFGGCSRLKSITIPSSVTSIEYSAFCGCSGLTSITIPNSVISIGNYAFGSSGLKSITIPNSVTSIGASCFASCEGLTSITIPNSVTSIGNSAFSGCSGLASITIPDSVTSIEYSAFSGCSRLTSIEFPDSLTDIDYYAFYGCTSLKNILFTGDAPKIGINAFGSVTATVSVPENADWEKSDMQDYGGKLTWKKIAFPVKSGECGDALTWEVKSRKLSISGSGDMWNWSAEEKAPWAEAEFTRVIVAEGVTGIGAYAFENRSDLFSIAIPDSVVRIGEYAFKDCGSLTSVSLPSGLVQIEEGLFRGCTSLNAVAIPDGVTSIGADAFKNCASITELDFPAFVRTIGSGAIAGCNALKTLTVAGDNTVYASADNCIIERATNTVFMGCGNSRIPATVSKVGAYAFSGCSGLRAVTIPEGVSALGAYAFGSCANLTTIRFMGDKPEIDQTAFSGVTATVYTLADAAWTRADMRNYGGQLTWKKEDGNTEVTSGSCGYGANWSLSLNGTLTVSGSGSIRDFDIYEDAAPWNDHRGSIRRVVIENGITGIGDWAFARCGSLVSVSMPDSLGEIGSWAFESCTSLKTVTIPSGVTRIGWFAFEECVSLSEIVFRGNKPEIIDNAFEGVTATAYASWADDETESYCGNLTWEKCKHVWDKGVVTESPSCTENGEMTYTCSTCRATRKEPVEALGHNPVTDEAVGATCTETGLTEGIHCSRCTETIVAQSATPPLGHQEVSDEAVEATCTTSGLTEGSHCSRCNAAVNPQNVVPALGHDITDTVIEPTYTEQGYTVHTCSRCEYEVTDSYTEPLGVPYVAVTEQIEAVSEATEENVRENVQAMENLSDLAGAMEADSTGENIVNKIEQLEENTVGKAEIDVSGDTGIDAAGVTVVGANLNTPADPEQPITLKIESAQEQREISGDEYEENALSLSITLENTEEQKVPVRIVLPVPASIVEPENLIILHYHEGVSEPDRIRPSVYKSDGSWYAAFVAENFSDFVLVEKHEYVKTVTTPVTCTEDGLVTYTCKCGKSYTEGIPHKGHNTVTLDAVAATCTTDGLTEGSYCTVCKEVFTEQQVVRAGHTLVHHEARKASCTEPGWNAYDTCEHCAYTTYTEIPAAGHDYHEGICAVCGEIDESCFKDGRVDIEEEYIALESGDESALTITVEPEVLTARLAWNVEGDAVTVDNEGKVTAVKAGTAIITASVVIGGNEYTDCCRVDVLSPESKIEQVQLMTTTATVEVYQNVGYAELSILPVLEQNLKGLTGAGNTKPSASQGVVKSARFADEGMNAYFELRVKNDRTLEIVPKEKAIEDALAGKKDLKTKYKSAVIVEISGEEIKASPDLNLNVKKSTPVIKATAVNLNSVLTDEVYTLNLTGGKINAIEPNLTAAAKARKEAVPAYLSLDPAAKTVSLSGLPVKDGTKGNIYLLAYPEGWEVAVPVQVPFTVKATVPKMAFSLKTASLLAGTCDAAKVKITVSPEVFADAERFPVSVTKVEQQTGKTYTPVDPDEKLLTAVYSDGTLILGAPEKPADGLAHTYRVTLSVADKEFVYTVKTLAPAAPAMTAKVAGTINTMIPESPVTVTLTPKNYRLGSGERYGLVRIEQYKGKVKTSDDARELFACAVNENMLTICEKTVGTIQSGETYKAVVGVDMNGDGVWDSTLTVQLKITFAKTAPAIKVTLKAKGTIDPIRPDSAITLTPTVSNWYGKKEEQLRFRKSVGKTGAEAGIWPDEYTDLPFDVTANADGTFTLKANGNTEAGVSYTVQYVAAINGKEYVSSVVKLTIKAGKVTVKLSPMTVEMYKNDRYRRAEFTLSIPDASVAPIDRIVTDNGFGAAFAIDGLSNGSYALKYQDDKLPSAFKGGTVKLSVYLKGYVPLVATVNLKVNYK